MAVTQGLSTPGGVYLLQQAEHQQLLTLLLRTAIGSRAAHQLPLKIMPATIAMSLCNGLPLKQPHNLMFSRGQALCAAAGLLGRTRCLSHDTPSLACHIQAAGAARFRQPRSCLGVGVRQQHV